jgi:hypothetical protein
MRPLLLRCGLILVRTPPERIRSGILSPGRSIVLDFDFDADLELWKRQAALVALEFKSNADIVGLLALYHDMLKQEAERARVAKSKDSARGKVIIPDYDQVHPSADKDAVVLWMNTLATRQARPKL